ncbi:ABC transporter substrate-binding protein [Falsiroseomonas sp. HW251]|uniref:ABC transporter substrate-binding protein n=1 Tax=Falsiroseomonas sp. HW251 TaxID=3390998 RepID=UPI003D3172F0
MNAISASLSRRGLLAGAASAVAASRLSTPAFAQGTRRDLRIGVFGGDFGNISPVVRHDIQGGLIVNNVFDGLVRIDYQNRRIIPWLAEAWTQTDPLTWRVKIREGVKWQRGYGEMTAQDVLYSFQYHIDTRSAWFGSSFSALDTMRTDGTHVLEIKTKRPFGPLPAVTLGYGGNVVSEKAHKEIGPQAYQSRPIGQGPYLVESVRGTEVVLSKNPDYWRPGLPKMDRLFYRAIPDSSVRLQALQRRELDFMTHPEPREVAQAKRNTNFTSTTVVGWNWDYQQFNLTGTVNLPMMDKRVRQAISYAIDREAIVNEIYAGEATITDNQIPPGYMGHRQSLMRYPKNGDLNRARQLMTQAGVRGYSVDVITSDKDWLRKELELVAAMVSQIGITYRIRNMDMGGFNNLWLNNRFEQHLEDITLVAPDPDATSWWFLNSGGSSSALRNAEMDRLTDGGREETDPAKREAIYHQVVDLTLEECPLIYHCNVNFTQIFDRRLTGFTPTPQEYIEFMDQIAWT